MATRNTQQPGNVAEMLDELAQKTGATEIVTDRDKIRLEAHGSFIIGKLAEIKEFEPKKPDEKPLRVAGIDLVDGRAVRLNCPTDLARKLTGDIVGNFVCILNEGVKDTGHRTGTPMTTFKVWNLGKRLTDRYAALAETQQVNIVHDNRA